MRSKGIINTIAYIFLSAILLLPDLARSQSTDYQNYQHTFIVDSIRAGNHDAKGYNQYYFTLEISAIKNTAEERTKELKDRMTLKKDFASFAEIELETFTGWQQAANTEALASSYSFVVSGNDIRLLVANAMRDFNVKESEIAMRSRFFLKRKTSIYIFLGTTSLSQQSVTSQFHHQVLTLAAETI